MGARRLIYLGVAIVAILVAITTQSTRHVDETTDHVATATSLATSTTTTSTTTTTTTSTTTTSTLPPGERAVAELLESLTIDEKATQLVVFGGAGEDLASDVAESLGSPCVGGFFVSKNERNWQPATDPAAATTFISGLARAAEECRIRPLVSTDAEAGTRVLKLPVPPLPDPGTLAESHRRDPAAALAALLPAAAAFAREIGNTGVHVNLGVIADVDVAGDFYMARQRRSFGDDPLVVAAIAGAIVEGHCRAGVAATLKHFPNQGSTPEDPHQLESVAANDQSAWFDFGRLPYLDTQAPLIMTGHVRYDGIDDGWPASLSLTITSGWLRDGLNYDGVIITDDLHGMRGVAGELVRATRGAAAISAGADLALYLSAEEAAEVVAEIIGRAREDPQFAVRVDESAARVIRLKGALGLIPEFDPSWFSLCLDGGPAN